MTSFAISTTNTLASLLRSSLRSSQDADKAEDKLINQESKHKATPLMRGSMKGHLEVVNLLLSRGADVSVEDHHKDTALSIAIAKRHVDVGVSLISAGADKVREEKSGSDFSHSLLNELSIHSNTPPTGSQEQIRVDAADACGWERGQEDS